MQLRGLFLPNRSPGSADLVHNHDRPDLEPACWNLGSYRRIAEKIRTYIPQSSVVGMLLQHEEDYYVVRSSQIGLMQHDLFPGKWKGTSLSTWMQ